MSDKSSHFQRHIQFLVKLQCSVLVLWAIFLSSATLFLEGSAETIVSPKIRQTKAGQNNKYNITKTLGLVQVCFKLGFNLNVTFFLGHQVQGQNCSQTSIRSSRTKCQKSPI